MGLTGESGMLPQFFENVRRCALTLSHFCSHWLLGSGEQPPQSPSSSRDRGPPQTVREKSCDTCLMRFPLGWVRCTHLSS